MKTKNTALLADIALFFVAILWGGGFIAGKAALTTLTPTVILAFRFLGSALVMFLIFHKRMKHIPKNTWRAGIVLGIFMFVGFTVQTVALDYTTAGKQAFLIASYTVIVPFISWFLTKQKPGMFAIVAGILTLIGVGILCLNNNLTIQLGDGLSLLFAIIFGTQIVVIGIFAKNTDMVQFTTIQMFTAGIIASVVSVFFAPRPVFVSREALEGVLYLIIFCTAVAFTVQNVAQKYTSDTHTSILLSLESLFGVFMSVLLLGEVFTPRMAIGSAFIFAAVFISKLEKKPSTVKVKETNQPSLSVQ